MSTVFERPKAADPLAVRCGYCWADPDEPCRVLEPGVREARRTHLKRIRHARALEGIAPVRSLSPLGLPTTEREQKK